jgi:hypothetical protein
MKEFERSTGTKMYVVSDCGFQSEVDTLLDGLKLSDILLIRLHRKGHSFTGDSREYVKLPEYETQLDIENDGNKQEFENKIREAVSTWLISMIAKRSM